MRSGWVLGALAMAACGPVSGGGVVNGDRIGGARSAIFDQLDVDILGFEYQETLVTVTDLPDACHLTEDLIDVVSDGGDCDDLCDGYTDVAEEYHLTPRQYWSVTLSANTTDDEEGEFTFDRDLEEGDFVGDLSWLDGETLFDRDRCESVCEDEDWNDEGEDGEDGELDIASNDGDQLQADVSVDFGGDDHVDLHFTAERCDMSDWF